MDESLQKFDQKVLKCWSELGGGGVTSTVWVGTWWGWGGVSGDTGLLERGGQALVSAARQVCFTSWERINGSGGVCSELGPSFPW